MPGIRVALLAMVSIALIGATLARAESQRTHVTGALHNSTCPAICVGHNSSADDIHGRNVWCAWYGDHVRVHIDLFNASGHDLELSIQPTYYIRNHGRHGSSVFSRKSVPIGAHKRRQWFGDAGRPEGVSTGTPISSCEPELKDVYRS